MAAVMGAMLAVVAVLTVRYVRTRRSRKTEETGSDVMESAHDNVAMEVVTSRDMEPRDLARQMRENADVLF